LIENKSQIITYKTESGVPIVLLNAYPSMALIVSGCALIGIFLTEFVRIRVPQMIPLS